MAHNLHHFMVEQLMDIYDAEQQAAKALPKMVKAVSSPDVKRAFQDHVEQTKRQVQRLEEIFSKLGERMESKECKGMQGLVAESEEYIEQEGMDPEIRDSALVGAEQKAEHYEVAAYTSAVEMAELMGQKHAARLLRQTLTEEERMIRKLTQLSSRWLKKRWREEQRAEAA